ncbi:hypothetical protein BC834DRAFT_876782 [Gloeopeniophorella convolvens]|nr:hypothetical protein BC834DRAFT_876782 [Gloeopeniophorella convolvens]
MVEYVYARHDFLPEHDDEISFHAGERIEVVEKDDLYGDGWWQGRNLAGKVGLFPESYTQPAPVNPEQSTATLPATAATNPTPGPVDIGVSPVSSLPSPVPIPLQPLHEEPEPIAVSGNATPHTAPGPGRNNGGVMHATLTDVQQAIEQLGHNNDFDGSRSFTFSSTHEDTTDHETDRDTDTDADGEDWHRNARQRLAEGARRVTEEQAAREAAENRISIRSTAPPIDVELSDDSGDEAGEDLTGHRRRHSHIPEEEEEDNTALHGIAGRRFSGASSIQPSERFLVPSPAPPVEPDQGEDVATEAAMPTATQPSFPQIERALTPERPDNNNSLPSPVTPSSRRASTGLSTTVIEDSSTRPSSAQLAFPSKPHVLNLQEAAGVLPSPAASSTGHRHGYSISSATSSARMPASSFLSGPRSAEPSGIKKFQTEHPSDWSVDEVVDWLRSKGFDDGVCDKFTEQEITGDVLLELDVAVLKSEIGIAAYGKRMRIANAITELRRPPSVISSSAAEQQSQSQSRGSPYAAPLSSAGLVSLVSPESPPHTGDLAGTPAAQMRRDSDPGVRPSMEMALESSGSIGLGLAIPPALLPGHPQGKVVKGRPTHLSLSPSPSDGALGSSVTAITIEQEPHDEERAVLSDSDAKDVGAKGRGSLFRRQNSASSANGKASSARNSKEVGTPVSDVTHLSEGSRPVTGHERRKRSIDGTRDHQRLSIFGSTFAGTLGKSRKPPPRYSTAGEVEAPSPERHGALSLSRLYPGGGSRKSSTRTSAVESNSTLIASKEEKREKRASKDSAGSKEKKDPALLRKRTPSTAADSPRPVPPSEGGKLRAGQNILEQIGAPDHNGWMRKKGEHYNAWKNRYFVLKGPHLYWLRSNSPTETKIKGYVNIVGYRIVTDEKVDPGRYGFKLVHESDRTHYFSSDEQAVIREWMKALMKATIDRDYTKPVVSSVNVPTIPLAVAQAMNPAPRPPSPTARAATQRAMRRENTNQLSTRDAEILMSVPSVLTENGGGRAGDRPRIESFFSTLEASPVSPTMSPSAPTAPPVRPSREMRKKSTSEAYVEPELIEWANGHLPTALQISGAGPVCGGLELLRIAEHIKGQRTPLVPDSAFPRSLDEDKLEGFIALFDFLLDNDVKMGAISINDVRQGKRDKIVQLLKALRTWEEKRHAILQSIGKSSMQAGPFVAPVPWDE